jgi:hypothetical protein
MLARRRYFHAMRHAAVLAIMATSAQAQQPQQCGPHSDVVRFLAEKYGETRAGIGLRGADLVEIFAAPSGSWTITQTTPYGVTCLLAAGGGWEAVAPAPVGTPG